MKRFEDVGNACTWLANLVNASCHNQIWYVSYQLIASWCPYKEITWYNQHYMCAELVHACSVSLEYYDFQSFAILCELDSLHNLSSRWYYSQSDWNVSKDGNISIHMYIHTDKWNVILPKNGNIIRHTYIGKYIFIVWCRFLILLIQSCSRLVISVTEHLVEVVDNLSTTSVVSFRSEMELECILL